MRDVACKAMKVNTLGGTVHVEWDPDAALTLLGYLTFFAAHLKVSSRFGTLVADRLLRYASPRAPQPSKRDILDTVLLSILAAQSRYAHITALRSDGVTRERPAYSKVCR